MSFSSPDKEPVFHADRKQSLLGGEAISPVENRLDPKAFALTDLEKSGAGACAQQHILGCLRFCGPGLAGRDVIMHDGGVDTRHGALGLRDCECNEGDSSGW